MPGKRCITVNLKRSWVKEYCLLKVTYFVFKEESCCVLPATTSFAVSFKLQLDFMEVQAKVQAQNSKRIWLANSAKLGYTTGQNSSKILHNLNENFKTQAHFIAQNQARDPHGSTTAVVRIVRRLQGRASKHI